MRLRDLSRSAIVVFAALACVLWFAPRGRTQSEKHLTIYAPGAVYSVNLIQVEGQLYAGLSDLLEPLGTVEAREDGKKWKLRFVAAGGREVNAEFQDGKNKGKIRGQDIQLAGNFHMENGRGYVPLHNIGGLIPFFTGFQTSLHESSLRLLVGEVAIGFRQQLEKAPTPKVTYTFSAPVNPTVATEPGRIRLVFRRDAIVNSGTDSLQTGDSTITSTAFSDAGGTAQITVNASVPLTATFSDGNKMITIAPVPPAPPVEAAKPATPTPTPQPSAPAAAATTTTTPSAPAQPSAPPQPRFVVLIDPAHGGDERGAAITEKIPEKDVNLALARRIQHELQNRGVNAALLRSGDNTVGVDDRAVAANAAHPSIYLCIHAANLGTGLRIFTALMSPTGVAAHKFLLWHQAQAPYLDLSSQVAGSISAELSNRQIAVTALPAPLRPMRNIAAPAIAIELAPPDDDVTNINDGEYQQNVAAAVANGIAAMKPKLQGAR